MTPSQRELQGQAISNLRVMQSSDFPIIMLGKANGEELGPCVTIFQPGDLVIISSYTELALAQGSVINVTPSGISLRMDKEINCGPSSTYVIDKFEYSSSGSGNWLNLARLMSDNARSKFIRDHVIAKRPAEFVSGLSKDTALMAKPILRPMNLNSVQSKAIFKILMAKNFNLCLGMPGTGKTTLIVALVRLLAKMGKSVLLTTYTHSALDNVLVKLLKVNDNVPCFLRLGKLSRIHEAIKEHSEDYIIKRKNLTEIEDLKRLYKSQPVIATTCLSANNHPAFNDRTFDYCIVDEAGQSLLLSAIGPLFNAKKFVLLGDPMQLPPVVQSVKARAMGMDVSLFSHLQTPENTVALSVQYRMNKEIQDVANHMTYDGQLECGSEEVANRRAKNVEGWPSFLPLEAKDKSVVFFDTSNLKSMMEATDELGVSNYGEANYVTTLAKFAKKMEIEGSNPQKATVGIIAPYRAQVSLLRKLLSSTLPSSDISTVDQFQGRDKDIIIYSCTKTKPLKKVDDKSDDSSNESNVNILNDWRRLNVAVTRAKAILWIVGNVQALKSYEPFQKLSDYLEEKECIVQLKN